MRHRSPILTHLSVLALAGVLAAGPLGSVLASQACRHMVMHHAKQHQAGDRPCWCDQMTGGGMSVQPVVEALAPVTIVVAGLVQAVVVPFTPMVPIPESPSFAPIPHPPNGRLS